jgi:hypothetical protein
LVYDIEIVGEAGTGVAVNGLRELTIFRVIVTVTAGAGELVIGSEKVWLVVKAPPPHPFAAVVPDAAWTVKLAAVVPAMPEGAAGPNTSHAGSPEVVTEKGVPRLAADVTETV